MREKFEAEQTRPVASKKIKESSHPRVRCSRINIMALTHDIPALMFRVLSPGPLMEESPKIIVTNVYIWLAMQMMLEGCSWQTKVDPSTMLYAMEGARHYRYEARARASCQGRVIYAWKRRCPAKEWNSSAMDLWPWHCLAVSPCSCVASCTVLIHQNLPRYLTVGAQQSGMGRTSELLPLHVSSQEFSLVLAFDFSFKNAHQLALLTAHCCQQYGCPIAPFYP